MKKIITYIKKLLSDSSEVSTKRVTGFGSFLMIVQMVQMNLFAGKVPDGSLLVTLVTLITACFGLNAMIDINKVKAFKE